MLTYNTDIRSVQDHEGVSKNGLFLSFESKDKANLDECAFLKYFFKDYPKCSIMLKIGAENNFVESLFREQGWRIVTVVEDGSIVDLQADLSKVDQRITDVNHVGKDHDTRVEVDFAARKKIVANNQIKQIDYLRVDGGMQTLSVLKNVPWEQVKPGVLQCSFREEHKPFVGKIRYDLCDYIVAQGYALYISEWHPQEKETQICDWKTLKTYPCNLGDRDIWIDLFAFRVDPGLARIQQGLNQAIISRKSSLPAQLLSEKAKGKIKSRQMGETVVEKAQSMNSSVKVDLKNPGFRENYLKIYSGFAEKLKAQSLALFRIGQFAMWGLRFFKRHPVLGLQGGSLFVLLAALPLIFPVFAPYGMFFWCGAGALILAFGVGLGISFINMKTQTFIEREHLSRSALRQEFKKEVLEFKKEIQDLKVYSEQSIRQKLAGELQKNKKLTEQSIQHDLREEIQRLEKHLEELLKRELTQEEQKNKIFVKQLLRKEFLSELRKQNELWQQTEDASCALKLEHQKLENRLAFQATEFRELNNVLEKLGQEKAATLKQQGSLKTKIDNSEQELHKFNERFVGVEEKYQELKRMTGKLQSDVVATLNSQELFTGIVERTNNDFQKLGDRITASHVEYTVLKNITDKMLSQNEKTLQSQDVLLERISKDEKEWQIINVSLEDVVQKVQLVNDDMSGLSSTMDRLVSLAPLANFGEFQTFNRKLAKQHIEVLQNEWSHKLGIKTTQKGLSYMAHRIAMLECNLIGRLATTIEDAVLRTLIALSVNGDRLRFLEIGTLFGIGSAMLHTFARNQFSNIHCTLIDPLEDHAHQHSRDIITDEVVNEAIVRDNFTQAGVSKADLTLIKAVSTNEDAIKQASKSTYDVLIIDGDHSSAGVKADFLLYGPLVKRGGYIIFDNYVPWDCQAVSSFLDESVDNHPNLAFVGSSWHTIVYRVVEPLKKASEQPVIESNI